MQKFNRSIEHRQVRFERHWRDVTFPRFSSLADDISRNSTGRSFAYDSWIVPVNSYQATSNWDTTIRGKSSASFKPLKTWAYASCSGWVVRMVEGAFAPTAAIMVADYGNNSRHGNNALVTKNPPLFSRTPPNVRVTIRVIDVSPAVRVVLNALRGYDCAIRSSVKGWIKL